MFLIAFWKKWTQKLSRASSFSALFLLAFYRSVLSGALGLGGGCRFYPSCSEYAVLVYRSHSFLKASALVCKRLLACRPLGPRVRWEPELANKKPEKKAGAFKKGGLYEG